MAPLHPLYGRCVARRAYSRGAQAKSCPLDRNRRLCTMSCHQCESHWVLVGNHPAYEFQ